MDSEAWAAVYNKMLLSVKELFPYVVAVEALPGGGQLIVFAEHPVPSGAFFTYRSKKCQWTILIFIMCTCCVKSILTYNMLCEKNWFKRRCGRVAVLTASIVLTQYGKSPFPRVPCRCCPIRSGPPHQKNAGIPFLRVLGLFFPVGCGFGRRLPRTQHHAIIQQQPLTRQRSGNPLWQIKRRFLSWTMATWT